MSQPILNLILAFYSSTTLQPSSVEQNIQRGAKTTFPSATLLVNRMKDERGDIVFGVSGLSKGISNAEFQAVTQSIAKATGCSIVYAAPAAPGGRAVDATGKQLTVSGAPAELKFNCLTL